MEHYDLMHRERLQELQEEMNYLQFHHSLALQEIKQATQGYHLMRDTGIRHGPWNMFYHSVPLPDGNFVPRYASQEKLYGVVHDYDLTQEERHIVEASSSSLDFSEEFEEYLDSKQTITAVTLDFTSNTVEKNLLLDGSNDIFFEKKVMVGCEKYHEDENSIHLTQDDSPGMLFRGADGKVKDVCPETLFFSTEASLYYVCHSDRISYLFEHISMTYAIKDVLLVESSDGTKTCYFVPKIKAENVFFFIMRGQPFYIADRALYDFFGTKLRDVPVSHETYPPVCDGKSLYYVSGNEVVCLTVQAHTHHRVLFEGGDRVEVEIGHEFHIPAPEDDLDPETEREIEELVRQMENYYL